MSVCFNDVTLGVQGVFAQCIAHLAGQTVQFFALLPDNPLLQQDKFLGHGVQQALFDKVINLRPPLVHNAVNAKVQIGSAELKEIAQQVFELRTVVNHRFPSW